jgi:hypothetical protein
MPLQLHHGIIVIGFQRQVAVLGNCPMRCFTSCIHVVVGITLEEPSFLQESSSTMTDGMHKLPKFLDIWGINSVETQFSMPIFHIHAVEKKYVEVHSVALTTRPEDTDCIRIYPSTSESFARLFTLDFDRVIAGSNTPNAITDADRFESARYP